MTIPRSPTPDWAVSCMERVARFGDAELLEAVLALSVVLSGLNDKDRFNPAHIAVRDDVARAALDFGYRQTEDCAQHCEEYLGIAV